MFVVGDYLSEQASDGLSQKAVKRPHVPLTAEFTMSYYVYIAVTLIVLLVAKNSQW